MERRSLPRPRDVVPDGRQAEPGPNPVFAGPSVCGEAKGPGLEAGATPDVWQACARWKRRLGECALLIIGATSLTGDLHKKAPSPGRLRRLPSPARGEGLTMGSLDGAVIPPSPARGEGTPCPLLRNASPLHGPALSPRGRGLRGGAEPGEGVFADLAHGTRSGLYLRQRLHFDREALTRTMPAGLSGLPCPGRSTASASPSWGIIA